MNFQIVKITMKNRRKNRKYLNDRLKEECGVFGIFNNKDAAALTALGLHAYSIEGKKAVELFHLMEKFLFRKKTWISW